EAAPEGGEPVYSRRDVVVIRSDQSKRYDIQVESILPHPDAEGREATTSVVAETQVDSLRSQAGPRPVNLWEPLVADLRKRIRANRSTLLFANSRRLTEKVTRLLNEGEASDLAYSHHGSLSREIRAVVEERLKQGRLDAIVATNSLELGIDIGALDEVVLIQTPPSVAAAVQRIGRAGHRVGEESRGRFYPLYERDLLDSVVVADGVREQDIEEISPVTAPLDVLAQVIVSMVAAESWEVEELYAFLRTAQPYRRLSRRQFDLVLEMLSGRYADSRIRELDPHITHDRVDGTLRPRPGASRLIYTSGGTIPDRGYFHLRLQDGKAKLGELDEEFVWERSIGDTFSLGAQSWRITGISHNDVLVRPARRSSAMAPFWRADERDRSFHLSQRIGRFLEDSEQVLATTEGASDLHARLRSDHHLGEPASAALVTLLQAQRNATGGALPHRHHLLVERIRGQESPEGAQRVILHTFWGGRVNRPLALALSAVWANEKKGRLQIEQDNDCLMLLLPERVDPIQLLLEVQPDNLERLLRQSLEESGFFGARFRESAGRALLLPRGGFRRRVPLWFNRQRAKKLLAVVSKYDDFPILVEAWRTCLQDEFDLDSLAVVLTELEAGDIAWTEVSTTTPSPFAAEIVWKRTNRLMYEDDVPDASPRSRLGRDLLRELVHGSHLRPPIPNTLIERFESKVQRLYPGYAPQSAEELIDWVAERVALPASEWKGLREAIARDTEHDREEMAALERDAAERLVWLQLPEPSTERVLVHVEMVRRIAAALERSPGDLVAESLIPGGDVPAPPPPSTEPDRAAAAGVETLTELVAEWIRFYGPFSQNHLSRSLGISSERLEEMLESLVESERVVIDQFRQGSTPEAEFEICDTDNLERLLRLLRAESRPRFEARPAAELALFLASHQGLTPTGSDPAALMVALERLFGYPAKVGLWESECLPARLEPYYTGWLDALFQDTELVWVGQGKETLCFSLVADLDLFPPGSMTKDAAGADRPPEDAEAGAIFPSQPGRYRLEELMRVSGLDSAELSRRLWAKAWRGEASNTTFEVVRRGALNRFKAADVGAITGATTGARRPTLSRRARFERWSSTRPTSGEWFRLDNELDGEELDALDREELNKDRVRVLVQRYGVLFRALLARELPDLRWGELFRALRLMELSGELLSGYFFTGLPGLQFMAPQAFRRLDEGLANDVVYWLNATDPASLCGLGNEDLSDELPARRPSTHLVYHGTRLVVVSLRQGGELDIRVEPADPDLPRYFDFLKNLLTRQFSPRRAVTVETINGTDAADSPYAAILTDLFSVTREAGGNLKLRRQF
ncbi:MAG: helicase-related protein, partial [Acidobacteriota bacterium]